MWAKELNEMITEALKDKSKNGKNSLRLLTCIDDDVQKFAIKAYLERCKFKYVLAFLQWRSLSCHSNDETLIEIFMARLSILIETLK